MNDDLVSRQDAIDALDGEIEITGRTNAEAVKGYVRLVKDRLERLPSADLDLDGYSERLWKAAYNRGKRDAEPERKKGKWGSHGECPYCSYIRQWEDDKYCGNCGADLRGVRDDND